MFIPNDGYVISNITIDGVAQGAIYSYTFDSVTSNHTVVATFVPNTPIEAPPNQDVHDDAAYHQPSSNSLLSKLSSSLRTIFGIKTN